MNAHELLLDVLNQRSSKYVEERRRCEEEFSDDAVHDLRVASRRFLALLTLLEIIDSRQSLKKLRRTFKKQLDSLDELRDTQVMRAGIAESVAALPELEPFGEYLRKREKKLLKAAEGEIIETKTGKISGRVEKIRDDLTGQLAGRDLAPSLLSAVDNVNLTVRQRMGQVDHTRAAIIHRVRVAFKKFRYMLEIISPLLPNFPESQLEAMHEYQSRMGEIQDAEVFLRALDKFADKHKSYDPQPVRQVYEQRHTELINAYINKMDEFFTFWRETPEKSFPWEK
jgi:CHAD domain-containing protein